MILNKKSIEQSINIEKLLEYYDFKHAREDGDFIRSACKIHNGDNPTAFVINKDTGLWYCHTGCGGGDVYTLVQKMEQISFRESVEWVANFFGISIHDLDISKFNARQQAELTEWIRYNTALKAEAPVEKCTLTPEVKSIASFRNFKKETIDKFGIGYIDSISLTNKKGEVYELKNRLFFPIYFNNIYVGFSLRRVNNDDIMKWSHQPRDLHVGNMLFNYDNILTANEVVVCEGIIDVLAFDEINIPAVCTFGAHMSKKQQNLLLMTGADITFAYDGDEAGKKATQNAIKMLKNKSTLRQIKFNNGDDPASIGRDKLKSLFDERTKI